MFTRVSLVLAAVLATATIAAACAPPFLPPEELPPRKPAPDPTPFPQVGTVVALDSTDGTIKYTVVVREPVLRILESYPPRFGGIHWQNRLVTRKVKMDRLKFFDATGKQVTTEEVWKRLAIGTNFFVSADGNPVPAAHLKLIAPDALVVVDFENAILEQLMLVMQISNLGRDLPQSRLPNPWPLPEPR